MVDVIIPVKGRLPLLRETIACLTAQTLGAWYGYVIDDANGRLDLDGIQRLCNGEARLTVVSMPPGRSGACAARQIGLLASSSPFVVFLDSDDLLAPTALAERVEAVTKRPELDFVVSPTMVFSNVPGDRNVLTACTRNGIDDIVRLLRREPPWLSTGPTWRRAAIDRLGGWNEKAVLWQDWELSMRALIKGCRYARMASGISYWRTPGPHGSMGRSWSSKPYLQGQHEVILMTIDLLVTQHALLARHDVRQALCGLVVYTCQKLMQVGCRDLATHLWERLRSLGIPRRHHAVLLEAWWKYHNVRRVGRVVRLAADHLLPSQLLPPSSPFWMHAKPHEALRWEPDFDLEARP